MLGGRGAGKTRAGAEWITEEAIRGRAARIALVGDTLNDAREVMIEGPAGLKAVARPGAVPAYQPSRRRLVWPNGAVAQVFSAEDPDSLRGPQFDAAWCDEFAKWRRADHAFDMLQMALRLGRHPRQMITTTPRPVPALKRLLASAGTVMTHATTAMNRANLAAGFLATVTRRYEGTRLARQELEGELVEDHPGALWTLRLIESARVAAPPVLARIVVAVDPPATSSPGADECGIVAAGLGGDGHVYVLADHSGAGLAPSVWASRAVALMHSLCAEGIVAEANQGGEMVAAVLRHVDAAAPVRLVRASAAKAARAEPVAALYAQGRVHHVGTFAGLEDQMSAFGAEGGPRSPDRVDALVWAVGTLTGLTGEGPHIRRF